MGGLFYFMNQRIYNYCIHLLARQDYSEYKLRQKLRSKKDNLPHEIDEALDKLKEKGLLREENYKRLFIKKWLQKGESSNKIKMRANAEKLELTDENFANVHEEADLNKKDIIDALVQKKLRRVNPSELPYEEKLALKQKIFRFLISKGHSFEESNQAIKAYF